MRLPPGSKILFGVPAEPLPGRVSAAIFELIATIPGLVEAHLLQYCVPTVMKEPAHVLALVLASKEAVDPALRAMSSFLPRVLPTGAHLDVLPLQTTNSSLSAIRQTNCQIYPAEI
jgi:hypothetical protein